MRFLLSFVFILFLVANQAHAKDINDEGVAKLNKLFTKLIEARKEELGKEENILTTNGEIQIEKASNYYAVTLPPIEIANSEKEILKLGMTAINVTPTKNPDDWIMSAALPTPIFITDSSGKISQQITIGKQRANVRWSNTLENFSEIDIAYEDIRYIHEKSAEIVYIQFMNINSNLREKNKKVTGPYNIEMKNIFFGTSSRPTKSAIGEVRFNLNFEEMPINSLFENSNLFNIGNYGAFSFKGNIKDIRNKYDLGSFTFEYETKKPVKGTIDQNVKLGYIGADILKNQDDYIDLLPERVAINLDLNKLPYEDLAYILQTKASAPNQTALSAMNLMQSLTLLPSKMAREGTMFNIDNFDFFSEIYSLKTKGVLKASDMSPLAMIGDIEITAKGVKRVEEILEKKLDEEEDEKIKQALSNGLRQINLIQAFCLKEDGDEYSCRVSLDEEGQFKINKKSVGDVIDIFSVTNSQ
ncbi:MAG: hypothetical protein AAGB32_01030 [Pseudomonadota bacterium]